MNKFVDCLNVRNLYEGGNSRNENMMAFTSPENSRPQVVNRWISRLFLFVGTNGFGNLTRKQKYAAFSANSKMIKNSLIFNSWLRKIYRGGSNNNTTAYQVMNNLTQLRTVSAHTLAPKNGNANKDTESMCPLTTQLTKSMYFGVLPNCCQQKSTLSKIELVGPWIDEALGQIFGPNATTQCFKTGQSIVHAIRSLYLLDACLSTKLIELIVCYIHFSYSTRWHNKRYVNIT